MCAGTEAQAVPWSARATLGRPNVLKSSVTALVGAGAAMIRGGMSPGGNQIVAKQVLQIPATGLRFPGETPTQSTVRARTVSQSDGTGRRRAGGATW